ncbi:DUF7269 family protein [Halostagnicola larsenii]|uniref:DUF7269 family protein n=1 Tax=Halostagnicola larsenii TaxID=353800 RepID=UPI001F55F205|nr:hypothetical protein [Halostagnicola larsenii]
MAGVLSLVTGLVVLVSPALEEAAGWPWADDALLVAFFTVAFVLASFVASFEFLAGETSGETTKRPERVASKSPPGHELERILDRRWWSLPPSSAQRQRIRNQFQRAAMRSIVRTDGCSAAVARERIDRGTWTDDSIAAAFLCPDSELSRLQRVRIRLRFHHGARRTARAILTRSEKSSDRR